MLKLMEIGESWRIDRWMDGDRRCLKRKEKEMEDKTEKELEKEKTRSTNLSRVVIKVIKVIKVPKSSYNYLLLSTCKHILPILTFKDP